MLKDTSEHIRTLRSFDVEPYLMQAKLLLPRPLWRTRGPAPIMPFSLFIIKIKLKADLPLAAWSSIRLDNDILSRIKDRSPRVLEGRSPSSLQACQSKASSIYDNLFVSGFSHSPPIFKGFLLFLLFKRLKIHPLNV